MTESALAFLQKPYLILRQVDEILAQNVMGWELWNGDWWSHPDSTTGKRQFRAYDHDWRPTTDYHSAMEVWLKCLVRAAATNYRRSMHLPEDGSIHINGDHPVFKRLLVIDHNISVAIRCLAFALFSLEMPCPYSRSIINVELKHGEETKP